MPNKRTMNYYQLAGRPVCYLAAQDLGRFHLPEEAVPEPPFVLKRKVFQRPGDGLTVWRSRIFCCDTGKAAVFHRFID